MGEIRGIELARGCPILIHCFLGDDTLFFFKVDELNARKMKSLLDAYCEALGQLSNLDKSCVFFSPNTPKERREKIVGSLGISSSDHLGKYLGLLTI